MPGSRRVGWKEIAEFIGRDVRTAQRYESDGMPVHRIKGKVFAFDEELARWIELQVVSASPKPTSDSAPESVFAPPESPPAGPDLVRPLVRQSSIRRRAAWLAAGSLPFLVAAIWRLGAGREPPEAAMVGRVFAVGTTEGRAPRRIPIPVRAEALGVTPDGRKLLISAETSSEVCILDVETGRTTAVPIPSQASQIVVTQNGGLAFAALRVTGVAVIDTSSNVVRTIQTDGRVMDIAPTPDGQYLWLAMGSRGVRRAAVFKDELTQITEEVCPEYVRLDSAGNRAYVSYQCGGPSGRKGHDSVEIFDVPRRKSLQVISGPPMVGGPIFFSTRSFAVIDGWDACVSKQYDGVGCPSRPTHILHVLNTANNSIVRSIGDSNGDSPAAFLDHRRLLMNGFRPLVLDVVTSLAVESLSRDPAGYYAFALAQAAGRLFLAGRGAREVVEFDAESASCAPPAEGLSMQLTADGVADDLVTGATLRGNVRYAPGHVGQAFYFDADSGPAFADWTGPFRVGYGEGSTLFYVKFDRTVDRQVVFSARHPLGPPFVTIGASEDSRLRVDGEFVGIGRVGLSSKTILEPGQWYHVAVSKSTAALSLFINGELESQQPLSPAEGPFYGEVQLAFGGDRIPAPGMTGKLDELLFYNRALRPDEVRELYRMREQGPCGIPMADHGPRIIQ